MEIAGISVEWLGLRRYDEALQLQQEAVADRLAGKTMDRLLLLEHPPVVTLGRRSERSNLRWSEEVLRARGIDLFEVSRGGDVTYHAPGQLVGYPILDLDALDRRDVHVHLRRLEGGLMEALEELGLPACRRAGFTGVFLDRTRAMRPARPPSSLDALDAPEARERKLASIGVGLRRWVSFHGFALNVTIDLAGFAAIVPCGLADVDMTSVAEELARAAPREGAMASDDAALDLRVREAVGRCVALALGR